MTDLDTITNREYRRAEIESIGSDDNANDCYQIIRRKHGMVYNREAAERGLLRVRKLIAEQNPE